MISQYILSEASNGAPHLLTIDEDTQHAAIWAASDIGLSSFSGKYTKEIETNSRCSIVVSIPACHAGNPGSIHGNGVFCFHLLEAG